MSVYLDCNATTPLEPAVETELFRAFSEEYGNSASRTHESGTRAKQAVQVARDRIGVVVGADRDEVLFTSGATESNNLVILGLAEAGRRQGRRHVISSQIEHKSVLEPLEELQRNGFEVELIPPNSGGWIEPESVKNALRPETLLVSVMHANNETGVLQPIEGISNVLRDHLAYFHVDAAQTFGKVFQPLRDQRIDLISASGHKIFGPKGIGALIVRQRGYEPPPLKPLTFGGGQERGLRPGTLPVPLIIAFGLAAKIAQADHAERVRRCEMFRDNLGRALFQLNPQINGDSTRLLPHVLNLSFPGVDSEALIVALKDEVEISNGSACTSASYKPSHVLKAMGLSDDEVMGAIRISWCHFTPEVDWQSVANKIKMIL